MTINENISTGRTQLGALMLDAVMVTAISPPVVAETYDVVINNGRVCLLYTTDAADDLQHE